MVVLRSFFSNRCLPRPVRGKLMARVGERRSLAFPEVVSSAKNPVVGIKISPDLMAPPQGSMYFMVNELACAGMKSGTS